MAQRLFVSSCRDSAGADALRGCWGRGSFSGNRQ